MANVVLKLTFLIFFCVISFVSYDINTSGSLEASQTGRFLRRNGVLIYIKPYYSKFEEKLITTRKWIIWNAPSYEEIKRTVDKYSKLVYKGVGAIYARTVELTNEALKWISPELPETILMLVLELFHAIIKGVYFAYDYLVYGYEQVVDYLYKNNIIQENWRQQLTVGLDNFGKTAYLYFNRFSEWVSKQARHYFV